MVVTQTDLRVEVLTTFEELCAARIEWRQLERTCASRVPFQTWEWAVAWWLHMREDGPGVRDSLRVCMVRREGGELVAIAPLMLTERPAGGPLRFRYLQLIGADANITELRFMLAVPELQNESFDAIQRYFKNQDRCWDWMAWEFPAERALTSTAAIDGRDVEEKPAFFLELKPSWEEFKKGLGRNIKESLRKCYNSLRRDGLSYSLEVLDHPAQMSLALEEFVALHRARANLQNSVAHPDVFSTDQSRAFLVEVCQRLASRGSTKVFRLHVDGRLVATRIGFVISDTLYMYYSGWDPEYGRYSVMTTLLAEAIQWAIKEGLGVVHLSTGADVSKQRWGAQEEHYIRVVQLSGRRGAAARYAAFNALLRGKHRLITRSVIPGFLLRGTGSAKRLTRSIPTTAAWGWAATLPLTLAALDLLDGRLDGVINLFSIAVS